MRVFISSTSEDLRAYRQAADVVRDGGWEPVLLNEHQPADPRPIVEMCREELRTSGLVLLLQAYRRGWVPGPEQEGDGTTSVTALELRCPLLPQRQEVARRSLGR